MASTTFGDFEYMEKLVYKLAIVLLVVGGLNWGFLGCCRINILEKIVGKGSGIARLLYILVGIAALGVMFNRDTYLPFLGESVFPCSVLSDQVPPGATRAVTLKVKPNAKVMYWATEPGEGSGDWRQAYRGFENAGVATSNMAGMVTLKVREPQGYSVPWRGQLAPHIHFRVCDKNGFIGRIKTLFLEDGRIEGFTGY